MNSSTPSVPTNHEWQRLWAQLVNAPFGTESLEFAQYCQGIVALAERGLISRQVAALSIAKVYGIPRYDDSDQREEIMQLALQLETSASINDESWRALNQLVSEYKAGST